MTGVIDELNRIGRPATFDNVMIRLRSALSDTEPRAYEAALVTLGRLAGADPCEGNGGADAAPDAVWIFARVMWVAWEAKSDAKEGSEVDAGDVRQAGSHLRYTATLRREAPPGDSVVFLMSPQERVHHAARAVAEENVYLVRPSEVVYLFDRLVRAWRTLRAQAAPNISIGQAAAIFQAEGALPSQWLSSLRTHQLREASPDAD